MASMDTETTSMKQEEPTGEIDVETYRNAVKMFMDLRRFKSALYWAEKVSVLTNNSPKDIYNLAQCMFLLNEYNRAAHIIRRSGLERSHLLCHYLLVECLYASKDFQEALNLMNSLEIEELNASLTNKDETDIQLYRDSNEPNKNEILGSLYLIKAKIFESMDKRDLAIDCYIHSLNKSIYMTEALDALVQHEMLMSWEEKELLQHILSGPSQGTEVETKILNYLYKKKLKKYYSTSESNYHVEKTPDNTQSKNNKTDQLKVNDSTEMKTPQTGATTLKSLAMHQLQHPLNRTEVMSPANRILHNLKSSSLSSFSIQSSLSRISMLNSTRPGNTSKINHTTVNKNSENYLKVNQALNLLENSVDVMISKAEQFFYNFKYKLCAKVIDEILQKDPYHKRTLFVQIGCLMELKDSNALFYMAQKLVELYPDDAIAWYAVGCYYDLINKAEQGRRYLTKAASLDPLFGPAWLAYGHSFAKEKEHDQAMAAYFKATQMMRGCHLPLLYIGVECGLTKNFEMAEKFFCQAMSLAPLDVFVLYERGVLKYEAEMFIEAEHIFRLTLSMVTDICNQNCESMSERWEPLLNNLGHCCRKNKKYEESLEFHTKALSLKPLNAQTYTSIGFVHALMGNLQEAIIMFHKSLSLKKRDDVFTSTILNVVLEEMVNNTFHDELDEGDLAAPVSIPIQILKESKIELNKESTDPFRKLQFDDDDDDDISLDMSLEK